MRGKTSLKDGLLIGLGAVIATAIAIPIIRAPADEVRYHLGMGPKPKKMEEEEVQAGYDYVIISKERHALDYFKMIDLVPRGERDLIVVDSANDLSEEDVTDAKVICDRPPPLWVSAKAREVVVVPLPTGPGVKKGEATLEHLVVVAGEPEIFRTSAVKKGEKRAKKRA